MSILITGANGFVGREICNLLTKNEVHFIATDISELHVSMKLDVTNDRDYQIFNKWEEKTTMLINKATTKFSPD